MTRLSVTLSEAKGLGQVEMLRFAQHDALAPHRTRSFGLGFTLVELVVVLVLITAMATMIVPRMAALSDSARLRESSQDLLLAARYAQGYAVIHGCQCRLVIDPTNNRYAIESQKDPQRDPAAFEPVPGPSGRVRRLASGVRFANVLIETLDPQRANDGVVTFNPTGEADGSVIEIRNDKQSYSVLINPTGGRIRLIAGRAAKSFDGRIDLDA